MFFASYYEALQYLSDEQLGVMMRVICEFAINGNEPDLSDPILKGYWVLIRPTLELSVIRSAARKSQTNRNQIDNKSQSNCEQNGNKTTTNQNQNNNKSKPNPNQTSIKIETNCNQTTIKPQSNRNQNCTDMDMDKEMDIVSINNYNNTKDINILINDVVEEKEKEKEETAATATEKNFIAELKSSQIWLEQMAMKFQLPADELRRRLDDFALDCECRGVAHKDENDARRHYNDWLRIKIDAEKRKKHDDRYKRRGTEITATSAEDYTTTF